MSNNASQNTQCGGSTSTTTATATTTATDSSTHTAVFQPRHLALPPPAPWHTYMSVPGGPTTVPSELVAPLHQQPSLEGAVHCSPFMPRHAVSLHQSPVRHTAVPQMYMGYSTVPPWSETHPLRTFPITLRPSTWQQNAHMNMITPNPLEAPAQTQLQVQMTTQLPRMRQQDHQIYHHRQQPDLHCAQRAQNNGVCLESTQQRETSAPNVQHDNCLAPAAVASDSTHFLNSSQSHLASHLVNTPSQNTLVAYFVHQLAAQQMAAGIYNIDYRRLQEVTQAVIASFQLTESNCSTISHPISFPGQIMLPAGYVHPVVTQESIAGLHNVQPEACSFTHPLGRSFFYSMLPQVNLSEHTVFYPSLLHAAQVFNASNIHRVRFLEPLGGIIQLIQSWRESQRSQTVLAIEAGVTNLEVNNEEELQESQNDSVEVSSPGLPTNDVQQLLVYRFHRQAVHHESNISCVVCMCDFEDGQLLCVLPCSHEFHDECVNKWLQINPNCPVCRHDVTHS